MKVHVFWDDDMSNDEDEAFEYNEDLRCSVCSSD